MGARTSGRQHNPVNYNEKAGAAGGAGGPAWAREIGGAEAATQPQPHKENSAPAAAAAAGKKGGAGRPAAKSAPAVAQKGRNAGLERLPIEDVKPASKSAGHARARSAGAAAAAAPAAAGKEVLPGVRVKAAAAPARQAEQQALPAAVPGGGKSGPAKAAPSAKPGGGVGRGLAAAPAAAAKSSTGGGSSGKRKAAAPPAAAEEPKPAANPAQASVPARAAGAAKRQKSALAAAAQAQQRQPEQKQAPAAAAAAATSLLAGGAQGMLEAAPPPGSGAEELVEFYSTNFQALQAEYVRLQAEYEDLKAAKIDEEVQALLEQQNRHVTEHGQKAAQLVEHYKAEAEHHTATAAELGGEAVMEQWSQLQADLMNCQQALLDKEAESLEKERQVAAMQARLTYLERYARVYESADKCIQTDELPHASASAQFPSLQSSGVEMLQAHALVPEGAGGGSIYRRPRPEAAARPEEDPSYTLPGLTPLPTGAVEAAAAGAATAARSPVVAGGPVEASAAGGAAAAAAAAGAPISGSDMELTGGDEALQAPAQLQGLPEQGRPSLQQLQLQSLAAQQQPAAAAQQQQRRRHSLQPVSGRLAHAAAAPVPAPVLRPASAESQVLPTAADAGGRQQQRRGPSGAHPGRRVSAPPAPLDRELHFSSTSTAPAPLHLRPSQGLLEAVPEEQPLPSAAGAQPAPSPRGQQQQPAGSMAATAGTPASVPAPPRDQAITALTGIVATPLKGGVYQYTEPRYGFVFQLAPASPDSADMTGEEDCGWLCYRPISLGATAQLLPDYLRSDITFKEAERPSFFFHLLNALQSKP